jgi:acyl-CoA synthetase (AMP-forming)/AMP-acid ligase II
MMLIHDYLDYWSQRDSDREAITDGELSWSRAELSARSRRIANFLTEHVAAGERFAVLAKNSFDYLAIYLAASRCGAVPVPVNYRLAPPEWRFILDDAEVKLVLADTEFAAALDTVRAELKSPQTFFTLDGELDGWATFNDAVAVQADTTLAWRSRSDDLVYQMYTSGTTGLPKGAMISQGAVVAHLQQLSTLVNVVDDPMTLTVMPMYHAGGAVTAINTIAQGGSVYMMSDFLPSEVARVLDEDGITAVTFVPAMIQALLVMVPGLTDLEFERLDAIY